jgi:hypothetical protein
MKANESEKIEKGKHISIFSQNQTDRNTLDLFSIYNEYFNLVGP